MHQPHDTKHFTSKAWEPADPHDRNIQLYTADLMQWLQKIEGILLHASDGNNAQTACKGNGSQATCELVSGTVDRTVLAIASSFLVTGFAN